MHVRVAQLWRPCKQAVRHPVVSRYGRQAAAPRVLQRGMRIELPHERSAAAGMPDCPGFGADPTPCNPVTGPEAPIKQEPLRGCMTTLEAIARCANPVGA